MRPVTCHGDVHPLPHLCVVLGWGLLSLGLSSSRRRWVSSGTDPPKGSPTSKAWELQCLGGLASQVRLWCDSDPVIPRSDPASEQSLFPPSAFAERDLIYYEFWYTSISICQFLAEEVTSY